MFLLLSYRMAGNFCHRQINTQTMIEERNIGNDDHHQQVDQFPIVVDNNQDDDKINKFFFHLKFVFFLSFCTGKIFVFIDPKRSLEWLKINLMANKL